MLKKYIDAFCNETNDNYKNCDERILNKIEILYYNDEVWDYKQFLKDIKINSTNIVEETPHIYDFIKIVFKEPAKIAKMETFINTLIKYDKNGEKDCGADCNLEKGVYVNSSRLPIIFKPEFLSKLDQPNHFSVTKGSGKINLNDVANKLKIKSIKYIFLIAVGEAPLINLYEKYGFYVYSQPFVANYITDKNVISENAMMYGKIDDIISRTQ